MDDHSQRDRLFDLLEAAAGLENDFHRRPPARRINRINSFQGVRLHCDLYLLAFRLGIRTWNPHIEYLVNAPLIAEKTAYGNHTWGELIQVSAFFDQAAGERNNPTSNDPQGFTNIRSVGLGLRINLPSILEARAFLAWELSQGEAQNERRPQFWADLIYRF